MSFSNRRSFLSPKDRPICFIVSYPDCQAIGKIWHTAISCSFCCSYLTCIFVTKSFLYCTNPSYPDCQAIGKTRHKICQHHLPARRIPSLATHSISSFRSQPAGRSSLIIFGAFESSNLVDASRVFILIKNRIGCRDIVGRGLNCQKDRG